jgi:hypothetical protein
MMDFDRMPFVLPTLFSRDIFHSYHNLDRQTNHILVLLSRIQALEAMMNSKGSSITPSPDQMERSSELKVC